MRKTWGKLGAIIGPFLLASLLFLMFSPTICHAQNNYTIDDCFAYQPDDNDRDPPLSSGVAWVQGSSYTVTIDGPVLTGPMDGCGVAWLSSWVMLPPPVPDNLKDLLIGPPYTGVTLSNLKSEGPYKSRFDVSVTGAAPQGIVITLQTNSNNEDGIAGIWYIQIVAPPTPPAPPPPPACPTPVLTAVKPDIWFAGKTYNPTLTGGGFTNTTDCPAPSVNITDVNYNSIPYSNVKVKSNTEMKVIAVAPPASNPTETVCVTLGNETAVPNVVSKRASAAANAADAAPAPGEPGSACTDNYGLTGITVQILNGLTITSVTPLGWWAGQTQEITITGSGFLKTSDPGGPTSLTVSAPGVNMTNPEVVSDTEITATVDVTKKAPAEIVTLKVTNPSSSGGSKSATAKPAPVVLPVPEIKWKDNTISGDDAKTQKVQVGQPVELTTTPASLPGGFTVSGSKWTIPGTNIWKFSHPNSGIVLTPTQTDQLNTTYYWLYPKDAMNVVYTYCATDPNGNQICKSPEAKAVFNAKSPGSLTIATDDSQLALVQKLDTCNPAGTAPYLEYGDLSGPAPGCGPDEGNPGIHLTASGASSGSYVFAQIVNADINEYTHAIGPSPTFCGVHDGLDKSFPFLGVEKAHPQVAYDGPQMPLFSNSLTGTRTFHASMYLLWQSDEPKSIPVPIGHQDWQFVATAIQNAKGKWEKHGVLTASGDEGEGFVPSTPYDNAIYGYPQWSYLSSTDCGVSQEEQQ